MALKLVRRYLLFNVLIMLGTGILAQDKVPLGIHYQAVARDNYGKELVNKKIKVKFSVIAEDPLSAPVFQELHPNVITSRFGVFSLVIGSGVTTGKAKFTTLSEIEWKTANHYLKVEVQFENENEFMDMGTMQFLSVPYALFAQKSLEPGPQGPKGDPGPKGDTGDQASDDQTLSVVNIDGADYLAISGGNQVKVSSIEKDGDPTNEIQDLVFNSYTRELQLTKSSLGVVNLSELKNDADADPANEIQDLKLASDKLTITGKTNPAEINLGVYRDNTDSQQLTYSEAGNSLSISGGNNVALGTLTAFRAKKTISTNAATPLASVDFIPDNIEYNDGNGLNITTGEFTATYTGLYTFDIKYVAPGDGKIVYIYKNGNLYETLATGLTTGAIIFRTITIKLLAADKIKMVVNTGTDTSIGTGTFSGYKVY
jgi:hypothetical protein